MAADWSVDFPLDARGRELVLRRIRGALGVAPASSPLTAVLRVFEAQVAAGEDRLRLPVSRLDVFGLIHWSEFLRNLPTPTGEVRCDRCDGKGTLTLPPVLAGLAGQFDFDYHLAQLGPPERQPYLDESPDPAERERAAAKRKAEAARAAAVLRQQEQRSYGVLPGTPRIEVPEERPVPAAADFMPAGYRR